MKLKALLLALFTAGFAVSVAVAAAPADKGRPGKPEAAAKAERPAKAAKVEKACKPSRKIVVRGEFVSASATGFALKIAGGNRPAKPWKGKQATVLVDDRTRFNGAKRKLADLAAGDRVNVQGYACKADAAAGSLLARKVTTRGAQDDDAADETTSTGTTTGTTTTGTTTTGTTTGVTTTTP